MSSKHRPESDTDQPMVYQIRLKGHLSRQRMDWFEGMTITLEDNGNTFLTGTVIDQAGLHGILKKIRDLGMPLISVNSIEPSLQDPSEDKNQKAGDL
jgi:hypothetical protein